MYSIAAITADDEVTAAPWIWRNTLRLTSSHSCAIPASGPTLVRRTKPPLTGSIESATMGVPPSGHDPAMIPATCVPWPTSSVRAEPPLSGNGMFGCTSREKSLCSPPVRGSLSAFTRPSRASSSREKWPWAASMPVSMTAHTIPEPLALNARRAASTLTVGAERSTWAKRT